MSAARYLAAGALKASIVRNISIWASARGTWVEDVPWSCGVPASKMSRVMKDMPPQKPDCVWSRETVGSGGIVTVNAVPGGQGPLVNRGALVDGRKLGTAGMDGTAFTLGCRCARFRGRV